METIKFFYFIGPIYKTELDWEILFGDKIKHITEIWNKRKSPVYLKSQDAVRTNFTQKPK